MVCLSFEFVRPAFDRNMSIKPNIVKVTLPEEVGSFYGGGGDYHSALQDDDYLKTGNRRICANFVNIGTQTEPEPQRAHKDRRVSAEHDIGKRYSGHGDVTQGVSNDKV